MISSDQNFDFNLQFSDVDIGTGGSDGLNISTVNPTITSPLNEALAAQQNTNFLGSASLTLSSMDCLDVSYLCINLITDSIGASYIDVDQTRVSNTDCMDISTQKSCEPGKDVKVSLWFVKKCVYFYSIQRIIQR